MYLEVREAVLFLARFLFNKFPRRKINLLVDHLANLLILKYKTIWWIDRPQREADLRAIKFKVDGKSEHLLTVVAETIGLDLNEILHHIASELTIWVNPGQVYYRVGEHGPIQWLYKVNENDKKSPSKFNHDDMKVGFCQTEMNKNAPKFSVGSFALTRFGTSKLKPDLSTLKAIQRNAVLKAVISQSSFDTSPSTRQLFLHEQLPLLPVHQSHCDQ